MRNINEKIVIGIIIIFLILFVIAILYNVKINKLGVQQNVLDDTILMNDIEDNTINEITANTIITENIVNTQESATNNVQNSSKTEEKKSKKEELKSKATKTITSKQKVVEQTKEEITKPQAPKTEVTTPNTQTSSKQDTTSSSNLIVQDTIKRITKEQLNSEKSRFLNDIKSKKPGFKYVFSKRGQVFWPYRTSEIDIAVGGVNFGIIYYYVDTFVEGNQEKFKYYIDWAGN